LTPAPFITGVWSPGGKPPVDDEQTIRSALQNVNDSVILIDLNGRLGMARAGSTHFSDRVNQAFDGYPIVAMVPALPLENLGNPRFKQIMGLKYPYVMGAMAHGITSVKMVCAAAKAGMMGFFGAAGLMPAEVESAIDRIQADVGDLPFGFNLIHSPYDPELESRIVALYIRHSIRRVCASAFLNLTPALVRYRVSGIHLNQKGDIVCPNQVVAKVSREEVARKFFSPPPDKLLNQLVESGAINMQEAELARHIPMCDALTAEADSGGHTDNRPALALFPTILALRDEMVGIHRYKQAIPVGLGGGICTPHATAAAFAMGAAYVLTGSINQSCVEAGVSEPVKRLLAETRQADVAMSPCADMFEMGVRVQVLKRGTMFAQRAARLYEIYSTYDRIEDIPQAVRVQLERDYFRCSLEQEWTNTCAFFMNRNQDQTGKGNANPKQKMALIFRSYLGRSSLWAQQGDESRKMDYQIWCGPGMGAFNAWVAGTFLEKPENRDVVTVALNLLLGASVLTRLNWIRCQGVSIPPWLHQFHPLSREAILMHTRKLSS